MAGRKAHSKLQRVRLFDRHGGKCHMCDQRIHAERGELWDISHPIPLEIGGKDDETNWAPAHRSCHKKHTAEVDAPLIAKTHRQRAKHLGIRPKSKFAGSRESRWRKKINGEVVAR